MRRIVLVPAAIAALVLAASACGSTRGEEPAAMATDTPPTPTPTASVPATPTPTPANVVRFVALGDTGTGGATQYAVASAIAQKCAASGCDFGVLLGDNFYPSGVASPDDPLFDSMFQNVYGPLGFPFYVVLGNHDYGTNGAGLEFNKGAYEVAYGESHPNWKMPAEYFAFDSDPALFMILGTNLIFWDHNAAIATQGQFFGGQIAATSQPWKIAFGHHPYYSNGEHGNAGNYDNVGLIPIANGENVKKFFDQSLCGKIDLYVCGHDHSRQILPGTTDCPGTFVVSGAGAKTTTLPGSDPSLFQRDTPGFTWFEVAADAIRIEMLDSAGNLEFTTTLTH